MIEIQLTQGYTAIVDDEDAHVTAYTWYLVKPRKRSTVYAQTRIDGKTVSLQKLLLNAPTGCHVDHIDGNGLNNRRSNLRVVTRSQNQCNRGKQRNNTSGFKGVCFYKPYKKFMAYIKVNRKQRTLGYFETAAEAARAYDDAAKTLHGECAHLNRP